MKLIFCPTCQDVRKILTKKVKCSCGLSWGQYIDDINAKIGGMSIPLGFANSTFVRAIYEREAKTDNTSTIFTAFVIEKDCKTVRIIK